MKRKKVGLLGAGQLAFFLAKGLKERDVEVYIYGNSIDDPAMNLADQSFLSSEHDLSHFFQACDLIILESEFFSHDILNKLSLEYQTPVYPELNAFSELATKTRQKHFFDRVQVPTPKTEFLSDIKDNKMIEFPVMLKKSFGSYDGTGNLIVKSIEEFESKIGGFRGSKNSEILIQELVDIDIEFACMLVKSSEEVLILPPVLTHQEKSICHLVSYPSGLDEKTQLALNKYMQQIAHGLDGDGVFAFEFFKTKSGKILINEAAPRVHNSYHFSIEGLNYSQFDLMVRVALGEKLPSIESKYPFISMVNIIGQTEGQDYQLELPKLAEQIDVNIHLYGKKESKVGRKLGHVTLCGDVDHINIAQKVAREYRL